MNHENMTITRSEIRRMIEEGEISRTIEIPGPEDQPDRFVGIFGVYTIIEDETEGDE